MDSLQREAERLRKARQFEEALPLYADLWRRPGDKWDGWGYALCLRRSNRASEALAVCREIYRKDPSFAQNNGLYAWCVYDTALKPIINDGGAFDRAGLIRAATAVLKLCQQDNFSPFALAVFKVVRLLGRRRAGGAREALEWLDRLDPLRLDTRPFVLKGPRSRHLPSDRERWFLSRAHLLRSLERNEDCITVCDQGLASQGGFQADTTFWLQRHRGLALLKLGRLDDAAAQFRDLLSRARKRAPWFVLVDAADIALRQGKANEAWVFLAEATAEPGDAAMRLRLFGLMMEALRSLDRQEDAALHAALVRRLCREQGWQVPEQARATAALSVADEHANLDSAALVATLSPMWAVARAQARPTQAGILRALLPDGRAGFITTATGASVYFKLRAARCPAATLVPGAKVRFRERPSFDAKRQRESVEAFDVEVVTA